MAYHRGSHEACLLVHDIKPLHRVGGGNHRRLDNDHTPRRITGDMARGESRRRTQYASLVAVQRESEGWVLGERVSPVDQGPGGFWRHAKTFKLSKGRWAQLRIRRGCVQHQRGNHREAHATKNSKCHIWVPKSVSCSNQWNDCTQAAAGEIGSNGEETIARNGMIPWILNRRSVAPSAPKGWACRYHRQPTLLAFWMNTLERLRSGQLRGSTRLQLACGLTEFPREIFDLADTLEILDLSGNALHTLPEDLPRLHRLRILFCSNNRFTELPMVLGQCPQLTMVGFKANQIHTVPSQALPRGLRWLILTDNHVQALPPEIGQCAQLQKLMLAGNRLQALPPELAACTRLELLRIAANRLSEFPAVVLGLPRLAWLAYAGNPFCEALESAAAAHAPVRPIAWHRLQLAHRLGEGASGVIHHATLHGPEGAHSVAVKLFKGAVTSDGLPHCEMAACIRAGAHPHLIPVLGQVADHPAGVQGLVLSLIDPAFANLAGPPSLDSCTRDIYAESAKFGVDAVVGIARAIASAAEALHAQGLMHGDLYAHNILHSAQGAALLGDFGAASFLVPGNTPQAHALQRMEVRAFACLLGELMARCPALDEAPGVQHLLTQLQRACYTTNRDTRPLFKDVHRALQSLWQ